MLTYRRFFLIVKFVALLCPPSHRATIHSCFSDFFEFAIEVYLTVISSHHVFRCRTQMESLKTIVEDTAAQLDHELKVEVLGSYRRGANSSGDVDCLITHPRYVATWTLAPFVMSPSSLR